MTELYRYTGTRIAQDVKETFGDTGNVQLTDPMLLRWINDGQRVVAQDSDFSRSQASTPLLAGTTVYDLTTLVTANRMKQVEAVTVSGKRLRLVPFAQYLKYLDDAVTTAGVPVLGMLRGNALTITPASSTTVADGLVIFFTQWPADLAQLTDLLTIPDRYTSVLRDYVLSQAYQMNDDLEGAQTKLGHVQAGIQSQYEREHIAPTDIYTVVPDDGEW